jgi:hypothetical protein
MKKLKLNDELLQHAERISREQQKAILGGYSSTTTTTGGCYTADCWAENGTLLGTINTYPTPCVADNQFTNQCVQKYGGGNTVWWTGCC